ncbi:hypothetical protein [Paenisporosarcina cavernae]|uniref:hypothetical protein n=1 Tax=Paenisporosarcina cavernae TaxID=2320858 RepID=UPI0013C3F274|nr:hypothetical protein [Paenisporosarcina cavernae]
MGKYQLDDKSKMAVQKYRDKNKGASFDKKQHLEKLREEILRKKQMKANDLTKE